jgi:hypothetical protein
MKIDILLTFNDDTERQGGSAALSATVSSLKANWN